MNNVDHSQKTSREEKTCLSIFDEFAEETTLHGVREISKYWSILPLRIFFILCQIGIWSVMSYHMYLVISQYIAEPVLVQTVTASDLSYEYPPLTFCPQLWLNVSRCEEMAIPQPAFLYALSLMKRMVVHANIDEVSAKKQLDKFMDEKNISTYFQLFKTLANDFSNESLYCQQCATWPPKKVVTEEGVCYQFKFKDWTPNYLSDNPPKIAYTPVIYPNASIYNSFHTIDFSEYIAIGMHEKDFLALDPIFALANHSFVFRVTPTRHELIDDSFTPCNQNPNETSLMCKAFCRQEIRDRACGLPTVLGYVRGSHKIGPHWNGTPLLSSIHKESVDDYYKAVLECNKKVQSELDKCEKEKCLPWCEEMTYSTSIQTLNTRRILEDLPNSTLAIIINYQVRAGVVKVMEVYSYTWYSFLSDVGGLIGLWCGASVVSTIPLATFMVDNCVFLCRRKWRRRVEKRKNQFMDDWKGKVENRHEIEANMVAMTNSSRTDKWNPPV